MEDLPQRTACGFVLYRPGPAGNEYLVLVNRARGEPGLPKGHAEPGESELETALRETEEETGLGDLDVREAFRICLTYRVRRRGTPYRKRVVYFAAAARPQAHVTLSREHAGFAWLPLRETLERMPHANLREAVRRAAMFLKDPAVCDLAPRSEAAAEAFLRDLPEAHDGLVAHLRGAARLARTFAKALAGAGVAVHVEATAVAALLHDVGRALGRHEDHQGAGIEHLRETPFAPYALACITHFTKGADREELLEAGMDPAMLDRWQALQDLRTMSWEEACCALADACMKGGTPVPPAERFADLRARYDAAPLIALQEFKTAGLRRRMAAALGRDPLEDVDL